MAFTRLHAARPTRLVGAASIAGGAVAIAMAILGPASAASAADGAPGAFAPVDKVSLCHRGIENVPGKDNGVQPEINVNVSSLIASAHLPDHPLDMIPPFDFVLKSNGQGLDVLKYDSNDKDLPAGAVPGELWAGISELGTNTDGDFEIRYTGKNWDPTTSPTFLANGCADPTPAPTTTTPAPDPTTTTPAPDPTTTTPAPDPTTTTPTPDPTTTTPTPDPTTTTPAPDPTTTTPVPDPTTTTPAPDPTTTTPVPDPTTTTPVPDPTTTTPAPDPTTSAVTQVLADESAVDPTDPTAVLASTGSGDVEPLLLVGLGLIAIGGVVLIESRRASRARG